MAHGTTTERHGTSTAFSEASLRSARRGRREPNVGDTERLLSVLGGAGLALWGLQRGGLTGMAGMALGAVLGSRGVTGHCPIYGSMEGSDGERRIAEREGWKRASAVVRNITVDRPREEVYRLWRDFANLPRFMQHVERIDVLSPERSHWVVHAPGGTTVESDSILTEDRPNEVLAWRSADGADVRNTGRVEFREAAGGRGTEIRAVLAYEPPGGAIGRALATLLGEEPSLQARDDLRRFKQMVETGEVATPAMRSPSSPSSLPR